MRALTSVDLRAIVHELRELEGSKVDRVQCIGDEVRLRLYKKEKKELVIKAGAGLWLTKYLKEAPKEPGNFCMLLRKHLGSAKVRAIRQQGFDRIAEIEFDKGYRIIAELFAKGNIIFCREWEIQHALRFEEWRDRSIKPKKQYKPPPPSKNLPELGPEEFASALRSGGKDLVRTLVMDLNLAGVYAEEACRAAGLQKNAKAGQLTDEEAGRVFEAVKRILEKAELVESPQIAKGIAVPFRLETLGEGKKYRTFNEAADDYLTAAEGEDDHKQAEEIRNKKIDKIKAKLAEQEKAAEMLEKEIVETRRKGELVKRHAADIDELLREAREKLKERVAEEALQGHAKVKPLKIIPKEQKLVVEIRED